MEAMVESGSKQGKDRRPASPWLGIYVGVGADELEQATHGRMTGMCFTDLAGMHQELQMLPAVREQPV